MPPHQTPGDGICKGVASWRVHEQTQLSRRGPQSRPTHPAFRERPLYARSSVYNTRYRRGIETGITRPLQLPQVEGVVLRKMRVVRKARPWHHHPPSIPSSLRVSVLQRRRQQQRRRRRLVRKRYHLRKALLSLLAPLSLRRLSHNRRPRLRSRSESVVAQKAQLRPRK